MIEQNTKLVDLERLAQYKALSDKLYAKRSSVETEVEHIIIDGHEAIDLGIVLPNGNHLLWAACNVGATTPEESGLLFQFGRTDGYAYGDTNHQFSTDIRPATMSGTVYRAGETLAFADDAANANMGGNWRMPTKAEIEALAALNFTNTTENGVYGIKFTHNGNSIFVPAAGYYSGYSHSFKDSGSLGKVGHSSIETGLYSSVLLFPSEEYHFYVREYYDGCSVRGVIELTDEQLEEAKKTTKFYTKQETYSKSETDAKIQALAESLATSDIKEDEYSEDEILNVINPTT